MERNKSKGSYRSFDVRRFDGRRFLKSRGGLIFFSRRLLVRSHFRNCIFNGKRNIRIIISFYVINIKIIFFAIVIRDL